MSIKCIAREDTYGLDYST